MEEAPRPRPRPPNNDPEGGGADAIAPKTLIVRVRNQRGLEISFLVKKSTKMSKVFHAYTERMRIDVESIRFTVDGEDIGMNDTPESLGLTNNDLIITNYTFSCVNELYYFLCRSSSLSEGELREIMDYYGPPNMMQNYDYEFFFWACSNEKVTAGFLRRLLE